MKTPHTVTGIDRDGNRISVTVKASSHESAARRLFASPAFIDAPSLIVCGGKKHWEPITIAR